MAEDLKAKAAKLIKGGKPEHILDAKEYPDGLVVVTIFGQKIKFPNKKGAPVELLTGPRIGRELVVKEAPPEVLEAMGVEDAEDLPPLPEILEEMQDRTLIQTDEGEVVIASDEDVFVKPHGVEDPQPSPGGVVLDETTPSGFVVDSGGEPIPEVEAALADEGDRIVTETEDVTEIPDKVSGSKSGSTRKRASKSTSKSTSKSSTRKSK